MPEHGLRATRSDPQRFFFVHVQKAAGTELFERLKRVFEPSQLYPDDSDGDPVAVAPQLLVDQLLARWDARRDEIRVVAGHFPLCTIELLDADFTTMTVLREPVERTLSFVRHHRWFVPGDREASFEEIYEDDFRFHGMIHNHMVKMFSLTTDEMDAGMLSHVDLTREHLERAKAQLAGVDVVGLQEDFEGFERELSRRFGWDLGPPLHANARGGTVTDDPEHEAAIRERIAEDNALDVELYEFARDEMSVRAST